MDVETVDASLWAVFPFAHEYGFDRAGETFARATSEWLPISEFKRNDAAPVLEVYGAQGIGADNVYEVWMPIIKK